MMQLNVHALMMMIRLCPDRKVVAANVKDDGSDDGVGGGVDRDGGGGA